jgi:hypothetical protein
MKSPHCLIRKIAVALILGLSVGCAPLTQTLAGDSGRAMVSVIYLGPAWGPDEKGDEVVYFLKQVTIRTAKDEQNRIYFCSIKPDGSERREIAQLWKEEPDQCIEGRPTAVHMEINAATKRAAIGVETGNRSGIFIVNLDGTGFQKVWPKEWETNRPTNASYPTWSPDGQWLAFEEWRFEKGYDYRHIVKCRPDGSGYRRLTDRDGFKINIQPAWSPTTNVIAYVHYPEGYPGQRYLWLMDGDGEHKRGTQLWGDYPRWSPDGRGILHGGYSIVEPSNGETVRRFSYTQDRSGIQMWPKWGTTGFVFVDSRKIGFTTSEGKGTRPLLTNSSRTLPQGGLAKEDSQW